MLRRCRQEANRPEEMVEAARALTYEASRYCDSGAKDMAKYSSMAKLLSTDVCMQVTTDCVQIFGGYGFVDETPASSPVDVEALREALGLDEQAFDALGVVDARHLHQDAFLALLLNDRFGDAGFVDAFRVVDPRPEQYTWWSNRGRAWEKNVGWRIDYQVVTPRLGRLVTRARIYKDKRFSDHAPLIIDYDFSLP